MEAATIGIIGGTGFGEAIAGSSSGRRITVDTPFGPPSGEILLVERDHTNVAILTRHGDGHLLNPSRVPYRANIYALKSLGVTQIIASGATGSLREDIRPTDLVICDQVIDKTFRRESTFFDDAFAAHVEFSHPFCDQLRQRLIECRNAVGATVHEEGTYVCMEGPQFSTRAESLMHRAWGGDLIGMTCMPEAKLAREAEICYALVALPTDYDCWREHDPAKTKESLLQEIVSNVRQAGQNAVRLAQSVIDSLLNKPIADCACRHALELGIWSDKSRVDSAALQKTALLTEKYFRDA